MKAKVLSHGNIIITNDRVYIGDVNNQPMEVITMAHELNIGNISGKTFQDHLDYFIDKMVQFNIGGAEKYNGLISGNVELGNYVDMGGYTWLVCHIDDNDFYLILNTIQETCKFNDEYTLVCVGSDIANKCSSFLATLPGPVQTLLQMTSVEGVTAKIFIPSYSHMNGGFSWFNSNSRRIACDESGTPIPYWLSTSGYSEHMYTIDASGAISDRKYYPMEGPLGFRPACRIALI